MFSSVKTSILTTIYLFSWFKEMAQLAQLPESSPVQIPFQNRWGYRGKSAPVNSGIWEYADLSTFRGASRNMKVLDASVDWGAANASSLLKSLH